MRKIYTTVLSSAIAMTALAQLPNIGFEEEWVESRPWNSVCDTLSMSAAAKGMDTTIVGLQPKGWIVSNVLGVVSPRDEEYGGGFGALGTTEVAAKVAGYNSESALKLKNNHNPFMATEIVPGYVSLGKTWATNTLDFLTFSPANKDGGVFGGMEYTSRPDAVSFYYTRAHGEGSNANATVVVYSWKGTWTQVNVPGNNTMMGDPVAVTMIDRERNILGMKTAQGGEVTASEDAELISRLIAPISGDAAEWTLFEMPIEYLSTAVPEKVNVIISANDYFDSEKVYENDEIVLDDVRLVFYSRLDSLSVNGTAVEGFDSKKYEYDLTSVEMPADASAIEAFLLKNVSAAEMNVSLDAATSTATITVTNANGADFDGNDTHVYTLKFKAGLAENSEEYKGEVTIGLKAIGLGDDMTIPGVVYITPDAADETKCTFSLPNFSLGEGANLGDIVVPNVERTATADGGYTYAGEVNPLHLSGAMDIYAKVTLEGTTDSEGKAHMDIHVLWLMDPENDPEGTKSSMPIEVVFNGVKTTNAISNIATDDSNAPVEYYTISGIKVAEGNLATGVYIRRQGNTVSKVYVK